MSKELTLLEHLEFIRNYEIDDERRTLNMNYACKQSFDLIETALKDYDNLKKEYKELDDEYKDFADHIVKQYNFLYAESLSNMKKLKALKIIKEMDAEVRYYKKRVLGISKGYYFVLGSVMYPITKEKYDLLKEALDENIKEINSR